MQEFKLSVAVILIGIVLVFLIVTIFLQRIRIKEHEKTISEITEIATIDPITGLLNRRATEYFLSRLIETGSVIEELREYEVQTFLPVSLMIIDYDFFERVNDSYGRSEGDNVLQTTANAIKNIINRNNDIVGRWGGDQFVAILANTSLENSRVMAERVREAVWKLTPDKFEFKISVSIGVVSADSWNDALQDSLIKSACKALSEAKLTGRNQVCCSERVENSLKIQ
jgi:diguanylate cyclase (GGDEF)-like protein